MDDAEPVKVALPDMGKMPADPVEEQLRLEVNRWFASRARNEELLLSMSLMYAEADAAFKAATERLAEYMRTRHEGVHTERTREYKGKR